ncbi:DNA alkylation repair protein [Streptococcus sanguinis]|uniref:DNA alkylation repair protein n=1 Tax=Streptococcus sanguinis TaxID=1305 RepID=UPI00210D1AC2|nr:DNA alkylation repair protein [Streptococcus sanguinis]
MNVEELVKELKAVAKPDDAVAMKAYMKNKFEFLGVKTPARRKLAKTFFKQQTDSVIDWNFINEAWNNPYRELQHTALDYLESRKKLFTPSDLSHLKSWLKQNLGGILLTFWSCDEDIWLRRLAIDHQLLRKEETDTELLEKILVNNLGQTEFFINKAIGWALRDYSKTNPDWVRDFIERHQTKMAALSIREGSKYL